MRSKFALFVAAATIGITSLGMASAEAAPPKTCTTTKTMTIQGVHHKFHYVVKQVWVKTGTDKAGNILSRPTTLTVKPQHSATWSVNSVHAEYWVVDHIDQTENYDGGRTRLATLNFTTNTSKGSRVVAVHATNILSQSGYIELRPCSYPTK